MKLAPLPPKPTPVGDYARPHGEVFAYPDAATLGQAAAWAFARMARSAGSSGFSVALSGGSTPAFFYRALASEDFIESVPWEHCSFYWSDERAVGPDHADSNYGLAKRELLDKLPAAPRLVERLRGEAVPLEDAAADYERRLRDAHPPGPSGVPELDLILLGLGDDGHAASLFPGTAALAEASRLIVANDVPDKGRRLTMTYPMINAAREVWFLASGANKAGKLAAIVEEGDPALPASLVRPLRHPRWFVDLPAAAALG
jgi:6-phosphogluconolactonase